MPLIARGRTWLALLPLVIAGMPACVDISAGESHYIDTVERRFTVSGTPSLDVRTFDGSVELTTWDRPEVLVVVEKHAIDKAAADRMLLTAEQSGDHITIDVHEEDNGRLNLTFGPHSARVTITAPVSVQVEAATGDGRVEVRDVQGNVRVRTGDGSIRLAQVTGSIEATSGDGSIDIDGTIANLRARSGDGRLRVRTDAPRPESEWSLSTGDGSIVLELPDRFDADLDATTGDGTVRIDGVGFSGDTGSRRRRVARGQIGSGGPLIRMRSGDGSITVRRTSDAAARQSTRSSR